MSRPPYPHRRQPNDFRCRCGVDAFTSTPPETWGDDCPVALREALAETEARAERAEAELAARGTCSDPLTALLDRLAEGAQVAAEEVDAAVGLVATFDSEAPVLAGLGGEQMQRVRLEVACVRGDSLTPQARLREYRLRAERAEAEIANLEDMSDRLDRQAVGMTEAFERLEAEALRLRDLVRHQRGPLHNAELITDEEYAALAADAGAVARLRGYDEMRRELTDLRTLGASIHKAVAAALEA